MADSSSSSIDQSEARAQIREDLAFMLRLTAAISQSPQPNPNPNPNQSDHSNINTISSDSWTANVIEESIDIPPPASASPASQATIESIPKTPIAETGMECTICLEVFDIGEEAREMTCKHRFHSGCIEKWLLIHASCPICRFVLMTTNNADQDCRRTVRFWLASRRTHHQS
ncbi:hypothetical protein ACFE04_004811 [Oxalis oulophora]